MERHVKGCTEVFSTRLSREDVNAPSLEIFKARVNGALGMI